jgi:hypothetical protein
MAYSEAADLLEMRLLGSVETEIKISNYDALKMGVPESQG